jgi:hypothetical protein
MKVDTLIEVLEEVDSNTTYSNDGDCVFCGSHNNRLDNCLEDCTRMKARQLLKEIKEADLSIKGMMNHFLKCMDKHI